jgi:hypothetical protein
MTVFPLSWRRSVISPFFAAVSTSGLGPATTPTDSLQSVAARRRGLMALGHRRRAPDWSSAGGDSHTPPTTTTTAGAGQPIVYTDCGSRTALCAGQYRRGGWCHHLGRCHVDQSSQSLVMLMGHEAPKNSWWWLAVATPRAASAPPGGGSMRAAWSER